MRYLGIDYGKRKVGFAISEGQIASPLKIIEISGLADGVQKTLQVIKKEGIDRIVVGVPESGEARKIADSFISQLKNKTEAEVITTEETLSSKDAKKLMVELNLSRKQRKSEDAYSATIILQQFLDTL